MEIVHVNEIKGGAKTSGVFVCVCADEFVTFASFLALQCASCLATSAALCVCVCMFLLTRSRFPFLFLSCYD